MRRVRRRFGGGTEVALYEMVEVAAVPTRAQHRAQAQGYEAIAGGGDRKSWISSASSSAVPPDERSHTGVNPPRRIGVTSGAQGGDWPAGGGDSAADAWPRSALPPAPPQTNER
ncbi:hypothetical protein SKAU_G00242100 [Synaphobranchus kaupii]|uniref:Uncharacterized protein n=1 Tax=Synaphobranchus kaupii TaxID=118154 RepID=A0A9Q1IUB9_SYNKA|nr:hypothetical protein SKAU_G00242100 [Synaphobranchus kaupii]